MNKPLIFDIAMGKTKPFNIRNEKISCPFCDTANLTNILDKRGHIIWLMNKYPVLQHTWPTVIIETNDDQGEFSTYDRKTATEVISFAIEKWQETMQSQKFASVLHFKNHGPMSGGSIRHPHSQIIGLENYDYRQDVKPSNMDGWLLCEEDGIRLTLSKDPLIGFFEYNLRFKPDTARTLISLRLQAVISYVLHSISQWSQSYNYFFYDLQDGYYYIKVVPRYVAPPLYIGYKIPQTGNDIHAEKIRQEIQYYWNKKY